MESYSPIVALAGSARLKIMGIEQKETAARNACFRLGQELAKAGWRIAVYGDDKDYIEAMWSEVMLKQVPHAGHSIVCYYPQ